MKTNCKIIEDLLPLYHDGVCSEASKKAVEEHLKECESCREELRLLGGYFSAPRTACEDEKAAAAAAKAWKKGRMQSFITGCILIFALLLFSVAGYGGVHYLTSATADDTEKMLSMVERGYYNENTEDMTLVQKEQNGNYLALLFDNSKGGNSVYVFERDGVFKNRWAYSGHGKRERFSGTVNSWEYRSSQGEDIIVFFGTELPDDIEEYYFENKKVTYTYRVDGNTALGIYVVTERDDEGDSSPSSDGN